MPGPTKAELLAYINGLGGSNGVLIGQELNNYLYTPGLDYDHNYLDLHDEVRKFPALMGTAMRRWNPLFTDAWIEDMLWVLTHHWNSGGLCTTMHNANSPWGGSPTATRTAPLSDVIDPAKAVYTTWMNELDDLGEQLTQLKDNDVVVLLRIFHEMTGLDNYWWSPTTAEWTGDPSGFTSEFVDVWQHAHDYLEDDWGLADNIIWVYGTTRRHGNSIDLSALFPGPGYADIAGCSCYSDSVDILSTGYSELQSIKAAYGTPLAFTEVGRVLGNTCSYWEASNIINRIHTDYTDMCYFLTWASFGTECHALVDLDNPSYVFDDPWCIYRGKVEPNTNVCGISFEQDDTTVFDEEADSADLSVSTPGLNSTSYKLSVTCDGTASYGLRFIQVYSGYADQLHIELHLDPNSRPLIFGDYIMPFRVTDADGTITDLLVVGISYYDGSSYSLYVTIWDDDASPNNSQSFTISDVEHSVDIYIARATGPSSENGRLEISIDGGPASVEYSDLDLYDTWPYYECVNLGDIAADVSSGVFFVDELWIDRDEWYTPPATYPVVRLSGRMLLHDGQMRINSTTS